MYSLPDCLDEQFDIVFTSYGTIGWLPDLDWWANVISRFLKPSGHFIIADFHPVVWMFDDDFHGIKYSYFNTDPISETTEGTYAEPDADLVQDFITWNHALFETLQSLINNEMEITDFREYDWSPYPASGMCRNLKKGNGGLTALEIKYRWYIQLKQQKSCHHKIVTAFLLYMNVKITFFS